MDLFLFLEGLAREFFLLLEELDGGVGRGCEGLADGDAVLFWGIEVFEGEAFEAWQGVVAEADRKGVWLRMNLFIGVVYDFIPYLKDSYEK